MLEFLTPDIIENVNSAWLPAVLGIASMGMSYKSGKQARRARRREAAARMAMARYNAQISRENAKAAAELIEYETEQRTMTQRDAQIEQQANVAARGFRIGGSDQTSLLEQAAAMQLDQINAMRNRDLTLLAGEKDAERIIKEGELGAEISKAKGKAEYRQGIGQALQTGVQTASAYLD